MKKIFKFSSLKKFLKLAKTVLQPIRGLVITEVIMFVIIFSFVFYCQYFVGFNSLSKSIKVSLFFSLSLFIFGAVYGSAILLRAKFFNGDYESPLKDDDKKGEPKDRNYGVANQLRM